MACVIKDTWPVYLINYGFWSLFFYSSSNFPLPSNFYSSLITKPTILHRHRNVLTTEGRWLQTLEIHNLATDGSQSQTTLEKTRKKIQSSNATWVKRECCFEGNVLLTSMWILVLMKCRINYSHYDISIELNAFCQLNSIKLVLLYSIIRLYY